MRVILLVATALSPLFSYSQNIGIGITNPTATLMINSSTNPQFHVRQTNTGDYARIRMQTGTSRYWDIAAYNHTTIDNERLNFYNSLAGDVLSLTGTGYVGISNTNPNAPLSFAASLGKKITLYPGGTGDIGFGVSSNRLQIYSDNPNADVAIGYDAAGTFNERFAFKPNGALAVSGSTGTSGQVLLSGGANASKWGNGLNYLFNNITEFVQTANNSSTNYNPIPGLTQSITLTKRSKVIVNLTGQLMSTTCFACGSQQGEIGISINTLIPFTGLVASRIPNGDFVNITTGNKVFTFDPGTYTLIPVYNNQLTDFRTLTASGFRMTVMIIPEE